VSQTVFFDAHDPSALSRAGDHDILKIRQRARDGALFVPKASVVSLLYAVANHDHVHLSGPTGSGKSALIDAVLADEQNYQSFTRALGLPRGPVRYRRVEMPTFESTAELFSFTRLAGAAEGGGTVQMPSAIADCLLEFEDLPDDHAPVLHLSEMGRVHSEAIQGALVSLLNDGPVYLADGRKIDGRRYCVLADSNYADGDRHYALTPLCAALNRRFKAQISSSWLPPELELAALIDLEPAADRTFAQKLVALADQIRSRQTTSGELSTLPPPTIYSMRYALQMARGAPGLSVETVLRHTVLGNAGPEDRDLCAQLLAGAFGLRASRRGRAANLSM